MSAQLLRAVAALVVLAGCAARASGPAAFVDLNALVRAHPLYGSLAQYDRQISALRATLRVPEFATRSQAVQNATRAIRAELDDAASRARTSGLPSEPGVRSDIEQTYRMQAAHLRSAAQRDMAQYRAALDAQRTAAISNYVRAMNAGVRQAYLARAQELYEKESALALDLAKNDAPRRLTLRAKLLTLVLPAEQRRSLQAQLQALRSHEDATVAARRRVDRATLASFLPPLREQANADIARMRAQIDARTAANVAARQRVLAAQTSGAATLDLPASRIALLSAGTGNPAAFLAARDDLSARFAAIRKDDDDATRATLGAIAALRGDRHALYDQIVGQIMRDAQQRAKERGFASVYPRTRAPAGSVDLTAAVRTDFL